MTFRKRLLLSGILTVFVPSIVCTLITFGLGTLLRSFLEYNGGRIFVYGIIVDNSTIAHWTSYLTFAGVFLSSVFCEQHIEESIARQVNEPLEELKGAARRFGEGDYSVRLDAESADENFTDVFTEFNNMADDINSAVNALEKQEQTRRELLMSISHDLRSPLTSVKAYVEGLIDGIASTPEAQQKYLRIIKEKADDIDRMVNVIFLFSKMDSGEYKPALEPISLPQELGGLVDTISPEYEEKGLLISYTEEVRPGFGTVTADADLLHRIFMNIIDNSLKYRKATPGKLDISLREGELDGKPFLAADFADNGIGVSDAALPHLFEVFYREDASRTNPKKGNGIGLAIVAKGMERMGGKATCRHTPGGGLTIRLLLPILTPNLTEGNTKNADL